MRGSWRLLSWAPLRRWGNHWLARTSVLWVVLVPLLATWLAPMAAHEHVVVLGERLRIALSLPFNWMTFYLTVLLFAGMRGLYAWRCPNIVRRFETFTDFRSNHLGITQFIQQVWELVREMTPPDLERFHQLFKVALQMEGNDSAEGDRIYEEVAALPDFNQRMRLFDWYRRAILSAQHEDLLSDLFDVVRHQASLLHPASILLAGLCLRLGMILLVLVILQTALQIIHVANAQHMTINQILFGG